MNLRRSLNWIVVSVYGLVATGVLAAALAVPAFRANGWASYAPLREWVLPPPVPIVVSVLYSTEKEAWLRQALAQAEADGLSLDGRPIRAQLSAQGSREMVLALINGEAQPDVIFPASSLQLSLLQQLSRDQFGVSVINPADLRRCRPVLETPLVLVAWRQRADVLWGTQPPADVWRQLQAAAVSDQGWSVYGQPDWGFVKYGQSDPLRSNSGYMALVLMTYGYFGRTSGLTSADLLGDGDFQAWLTDFQRAAVQPFPNSTGPLMNDMIAIGPSRYDIAAVYESTAIEQADNAVGRYGELRVYYPPATVVSDHPYCVLESTPASAWVTTEKQRAAEVLLDYLTAEPAQRAALVMHGFRPVNPAVPLDAAGGPFVRYPNLGLSPSLPPEVELPSGDVLNVLLDLWVRVGR